ncbi:hypothetical protein C8R45DRAFT_1078899 [Mycena sanguinolenta]|nr:hypothetical protein C8R45DRAFT_1078899 [Mycena sanguinolenta]
MCQKLMRVGKTQANTLKEDAESRICSSSSELNGREAAVIYTEPLAGSGAPRTIRTVLDLSLEVISLARSYEVEIVPILGWAVEARARTLLSLACRVHPVTASHHVGVRPVPRTTTLIIETLGGVPVFHVPFPIPTLPLLACLLGLGLHERKTQNDEENEKAPNRNNSRIPSRAKGKERRRDGDGGDAGMRRNTQGQGRGKVGRRTIRPLSVEERLVIARGCALPELHTQGMRELVREVDPASPHPLSAEHAFLCAWTACLFEAVEGPIQTRPSAINSRPPSAQSSLHRHPLFPLCHNTSATAALAPVRLEPPTLHEEPRERDPYPDTDLASSDTFDSFWRWVSYGMRMRFG